MIIGQQLENTEYVRTLYRRRRADKAEAAVHTQDRVDESRMPDSGSTGSTGSMERSTYPEARLDIAKIAEAARLRSIPADYGIREINDEST